MSTKGISVLPGAMTGWWAMGAAMMRVSGLWDVSVEGQVMRMGPWSLGPVAHMSVWDVGMLLGGSERGESG